MGIFSLWELFFPMGISHREYYDNVKNPSKFFPNGIDELMRPFPRMASPYEMIPTTGFEILWSPGIFLWTKKNPLWEYFSLWEF
jgi:hypothetical protein